MKIKKKDVVILRGRRERRKGHVVKILGDIVRIWRHKNGAFKGDYVDIPKRFLIRRHGYGHTFLREREGRTATDK